MNIISEICRARSTVILIYGTAEHHSEEVWEALSPDARRFILAEFRPTVWADTYDPNELGLMNLLTRPTYDTEPLIEQSGLGYLIAGNGKDSKDKDEKIVPFKEPEVALEPERHNHRIPPPGTYARRAVR